jgi:hypothetical protein
MLTCGFVRSNFAFAIDYASLQRHVTTQPTALALVDMANAPAIPYTNNH